MDRHKCPICGDHIRLDLESSRTKCESCGYEIEIEEKEITEKDINKYIDEYSKNVETVSSEIIHCNNCGAEMTKPKGSIVAKCPYCTSTSIDESSSDVVMPDYLIPFKVDEDSAFSKFRNWISGKFFAPNDLKHNLREKDMTGNYLPFWTYDTDAEASYSGERGTYYYVTREVTVNGKRETKQERKIRWKYTAGDVSNFYDDILICASSESIRKLVDNIDDSFDLGQLIPYDSSYLANYLAEKYTVNLKDGWNIAENIIENDLRRRCKCDIGGDEQRLNYMDTEYNNITFKHIFLPIWISSYEYKDKIYHFAINGQNGQIDGKYPLSFPKVASAVILAAGVLLGAWTYLHYS